jgi:hypothetical protein
MRRSLRENGLSIALFGLFFASLIGQFAPGHRAYNDQLESHGRSPIGFWPYLASGHSIEAVFENWESEFLQAWVGVFLTVFLYQKGSASSKKLEGQAPAPEPPGPDAPWPVKQGGWIKAIYANSLVIAFVLLFALSFVLHAVGGRRMYNNEQAEHDKAAVSLLGFLGTSEFWFQSFQNYQSEFLAPGATAVLSIYLRQEGSPESKEVHAPHHATGSE